MGVTLTELLALSNLADILEYHVAPRQYLAQDLFDGEQITTVEGKAIEVLFKGQRVFVDTVAVVQTDLIASNGVVHIISGVLIPPTEIPPTESTSLPSPLPLRPIIQVAVENQLTDLLSALVVVSVGRLCFVPFPQTLYMYVYIYVTPAQRFTELPVFANSKKALCLFIPAHAICSNPVRRGAYFGRPWTFYRVCPYQPGL